MRYEKTRIGGVSFSVRVCMVFCWCIRIFTQTLFVQQVLEMISVETMQYISVERKLKLNVYNTFTCLSVRLMDMLIRSWVNWDFLFYLRKVLSGKVIGFCMYQLLGISWSVVKYAKICFIILSMKINPSKVFVECVSVVLISKYDNHTVCFMDHID